MEYINEFEKRDSQLHKDVISLLEKNGMDPNIGYIAAFVSDIVELTDLPETFEVSSKITSTTNDSVKVKWEILNNSRPELVGKFIPDNFNSFPVDVQDMEVLGTAPWVNTVHAWEKVLNLMNRVSSNQKGVFEESFCHLKILFLLKRQCRESQALKE
jgi:hypothetical protein